MPSGNAHRTWFPEMVEATSSMQCCIAFVRRGTSVLPSSNARGAGGGAEPHEPVGAMILSRVRFGIAPAEPVNTLEKGWAAYRKQKASTSVARHWIQRRPAPVRVLIQISDNFHGTIALSECRRFDQNR